MWESAERFGAILVFAEHRYYGQSTVGRPKATDDVASSHTMMAASSAPSNLSAAAAVRSKVSGIDAGDVGKDGVGIGKDDTGIGGYGNGIGADDTGIGIDSDDTGGDGTGIGYDASAARGTSQRLAYLTSEQAMADYATLIREIKDEINSPEAPVIVFGGSYGGMLATWMRLKYPGSVDGAVAGSAPIWSFVGEHPAVDPGAFAKGVTRDATAAGGASPSCAANIRHAWHELLDRMDGTAVRRVQSSGSGIEGTGQTSGVLRTSTPGTKRKPPRRMKFEKPETAALSKSIGSVGAPLRLCPSQPLSTPDDLMAVMYWLQDAFDYLAMGNYPYPSSYILNGDGTLPAYPFRVACSGAIANPRLAAVGGDALLSALADAVSVFYNYTGDKPCFNYTQGVNPATRDDGDLWGYQYCTEMFMPMGRDGVTDMFWPQPWNQTLAVEQCQKQWGVKPKVTWADTVFGGRSLTAASNIVWSNGDLDPWARLGVTTSPSPSLRAVLVPGGAHHLDFMWSHPDDPAAVKKARKEERQLIAGWIAEKRGRRSLKGDQLLSWEEDLTQGAQVE
mmetsp:Transcript_28628/g.45936  ORF Transcript_28628/g.45936 Transcript_28628/m.45936 type:complete len:562 (-) Transcript_28628:158-1843(-)|eukprot:CAMPEP_0198703120 /NCGR_PEP_ID=MMETSP1468-20131203/389160_1 /TAXON_ID=1461545 /ORGANISM="Mantoniella sp, Strain CCMP1436" /LENGTH=561 /DNA_ID=CAMNT_0044461773 /DNA_START=961 /DNA_END=2646 /DNA_ORIENTATION=-